MKYNEGKKMVDEAKPQTVDTKEQTLKRAIELVNQGLDNLSTEELSKIYNILKAHNGEMSPAGEAFTKLDAFAQQKTQDFASGKENCAPEELEGMKALAQEVASVHKSTANQGQTTQRVVQEQRDFASRNNLTHLTPDFAKTLDKNIAEMDALIAGKDLLAQTADKKLEHPELASFATFFDNIDLTQDKDGIKNKEELRKEMLEMAIMQAEAELAVLPEFANLSADEKKKRLFQAIGTHADTLALETIKAQLIAEFKEANAGLLSHTENLTEEEKKELEEKTKEFQDEANKRVQGYIDRRYPSKHYSINNQVATVILITNSRGQVAFNNSIAEKTGSKTLRDRALAFDKRMKEKHPKLYQAAKKSMLSLAVGSTFGSVGLACLAGYNTYKLYKEQQKKYKESGFKGTYIEYLKKNPKEAVALITSGTLTAVSATFGGLDVAEHGWNAVGFVGKAIGDTAAAKAGNRLLKAAIRGGISVTSGLTNAGLDFRAALNTKDKAQRKKLYKQAAITAGASILGGAVGVLSAEYGDKVFGWFKGKFSSNDTGVDGITGAAPKADVINAQTQGRTPDFSNLKGNELDAKLHELGVNPKVYENMSPMQKEILLHKRVDELGDLAKETPAGAKAPENSADRGADTGPVTESQLKNMLNRNAERHPGVDMNKIYSQLKAAGIKNPEESFYKLEQARLLAPNDKIMTVEGTNIRSTMERVLKGEALSKADMEIINRSSANVDNTGHYLNDVRSQGGTGYSYRPNGKVITPENEGVAKGDGQQNIEGQRDSSGRGGKANPSQAPKNGQDNNANPAENPQGGKDNTPEEKTNPKENPQGEKVEKQGDNNQGTSPVQEQDENSPYAIHEGDGKDLIKAKQEAARAEAAWKAAVERVKLTGKSVDEFKSLPLTDAKRVEAEFKHAEAMKDEVKKQMEFSKKEIKLAKAERDQIGRAIEGRKNMEARMAEIKEELKRNGLDQTKAPEMTGNYGEDKRAVRAYYKEALANRKNHKEVMELLQERDILLKEINRQGPLSLMEEKYEAADSRYDELNRREQYRQNQEREEAEQRVENTSNQARSETEQKTQDVFSGMPDIEKEVFSRMSQYETTNLSTAEKLNNGELFGLKDKLGNNQYVGVDESGHAFKITEITNAGPGIDIMGRYLKIEVGKDHPMYQDLNSQDPLRRTMAQENFYNNFHEKCINKDFTTVKPIMTAGYANVKDSEGR